MPAVSIFEKISLPVPRERIYRRLGFKKGVTSLSPEARLQVESGMDKALDFIRLKGAAKRVGIREKSPSGIVLADGHDLASRKLASLLRGSDEVLLMGATAGPAIMEAIGSSSRAGDLTAGVIFDAVASEMTDCALDWISAYFATVLRREGRRLTLRRFSAGYADFGLENQDFIYKELELDRIGVRLTESCMLVPEKSVTAIAGIEKIR